jgi:glycosyltransferase involved in cell wall biosynthesis
MVCRHGFCRRFNFFDYSFNHWNIGPNIVSNGTLWANAHAMNITVILCTYNRCQDLVKALSSVALSRLPESVGWEVLVVDNNSHDRTRDVVADFSRRYPGRFRYLFESHPGKSYALNSGIAEARGDIIAFMDDDVTVDPTWLQKLTAPLLESNWAGCGGRILPVWNCTPPRWLPDTGRYPLSPLAVFDLGLEAGRLAEPPFGTNMAFQKAVLAKHGGFRTDLGPGPGNEIRHCEDSEFGNRLLSAGERLWYEPSAIVYHPVPQDRLRRDYFQSWWFDKARADIRAFGLPADVKPVLAGPLRLFRRLAVWTARWMLAFRPSRRFSNKLSVWYLAGQIAECYQQRAGKASPSDMRRQAFF